MPATPTVPTKPKSPRKRAAECLLAILNTHAFAPGSWPFMAPNGQAQSIIESAIRAAMRAAQRTKNSATRAELKATEHTRWGEGDYD